MSKVDVVEILKKSDALLEGHFLFLQENTVTDMYNVQKF